jgi:hypothetical protein
MEGSSVLMTQLQATGMGWCAGLGRLLNEFSEETMHLLLETLVVVVCADATAAAAWEQHLSPAVLRLWAANVTDPLLSVDALDVLQALADNPAALPRLQVAPVCPQMACFPSRQHPCLPAQQNCTCTSLTMRRIQN